MTALEIRIMAYAVLALFIVGGSAWGTYTLTSHHYERLIASDKVAQDAALQDAQQKVIDAQVERDAALSKVEKDHEVMVQADTASRSAILSSVRGLEAALHLRSVSGAVDHPAQPVGPAAVPASPGELAGAVAALNAATGEAIAACQHDSTNYAGILKLAPKVP